MGGSGGSGPSGEISTSPLSLTSTAMPLGKNRRAKTKKSGSKSHNSSSKSQKATHQDYAICHCRGFGMGCGKVVSATTRWRHRKNEKKKAQGKQWISSFTRELTFHTANAETLDTLFPDIATALRAPNAQEESVYEDSPVKFDGTLPTDEDSDNATQYFNLVREPETATPEYNPHDDDFHQATPMPESSSKTGREPIPLQRTFGFTDIEAEDDDSVNSVEVDEEEVIIEWDQARTVTDIDMLEEELVRMQMEEQLSNAQGQLLLEAESLISSSESSIAAKRENLTVLQQSLVARIAIVFLLLRIISFMDILKWHGSTYESYTLDASTYHPSTGHASSLRGSLT